MVKRKYPKELPGGVEFTPKLKYQMKHNFLNYIKEYQKQMLKRAKKSGKRKLC